MEALDVSDGMDAGALVQSQVMESPLSVEELELDSIMSSADAVRFDEATWRFLVVRSGTVSAFEAPWSRLGHGNQQAPHGEAEWTVIVPELTGDLTDLRLGCSLPNPSDPNEVTTLAMLQGSSQVHFRETLTGVTFTQGAVNEKQSLIGRSGPPAILGFFWSAVVNMPFVLVTADGMQMFKRGPSGLTLQSSRAVTTPDNISWFKYQHDTRLVLLGSADQLDKVYIFQLTNKKGVTRLPAVSLARVFYSPQAAQDHFSADHLHVVRTHHNDIYLCIMNPLHILVHVWRLRAECAEWIGVLQLPQVEVVAGLQGLRRRNRGIQMSIVDNLLAVQCAYCDKVLIYDLQLQPSIPRVGDLPCYQPVTGVLSWSPHLEVCRSGALSLQEWSECAQCSPPDVIIGFSELRVYRVTLDVHKLMQGSTLPLTAKFAVLCRRDKDLGARLKADKIAILKAVCQERIALDSLRALFDLINKNYKAMERELGAAGVCPPHIIQPLDVINDVLLWVHHEEAVDAPYLQAAVSQFCMSAATCKVAVPPSFDALLLDTVLEQGHSFQAEQLMMSARWQEDAVAEQVELTLRHGCPEGAFASLQLLGRQAARLPGTPTASRDLDASEPSAKAATHALEKYVRASLSMGNVVSAVRALQHKQHKSVPAVLVNAALEEAGKQDDPSLFAAVYRCCDQLVASSGSWRRAP